MAARIVKNGWSRHEAHEARRGRAGDARVHCGDLPDGGDRSMVNRVDEGVQDRTFDWYLNPDTAGRARVYSFMGLWLVSTKETWPNSEVFTQRREALAHARLVSSGGDRS